MSFCLSGIVSGMRDLIAILLPPLAGRLCGKPVLAVLNVLLTVCFWIPGAIHALCVVSSYKADRRAEKMAKMMRG